VWSKRAAAGCVLSAWLLAAPGSLDVSASVGATQPVVYSEDYPGGIRVVSGSGETRALSAHGDEPRWSPNGVRIAFLSDQGLPPSHDCNREEGNVPDCPQAIYVVNADGSGLRRVTKHVVYHVESSSWSPDSRQIAFVAYDGYPDGPWHVYVANVDGRDTRRLTRNRGSEFSPVWSPDGRSIAIVYGCCLRLVKTDGTGQRRIATSARPRSPFWSPDGRWIAYSSWNRSSSLDTLRIVRPSTQDDRPLARVHNTGGSLAAAWSPDSQRVAFIDRGLETIGVDGNNRRRLDPRVEYFYPPSWSADGREIVYAVTRRGGVWVTRANGSDRRRITRSGDSPQWRPLP
jgi:Tol biopolymer transport system component